MRSQRRRRKRLLDVEDAARTRTVPRGCEAAHWDAHNRRGPFSTAERYSIVDVIDPRRSLSAPTPVSRAEECGRGREGDVAFGDAPITKYHPRGPGLRLVKRYYYTCAGSPRGIADPNTYPTHRGTGRPGTRLTRSIWRCCFVLGYEWLCGWSRLARGRLSRYLDTSCDHGPKTA